MNSLTDDELLEVIKKFELGALNSNKLRSAIKQGLIKKYFGLLEKEFQKHLRKALKKKVSNAK